MHKAILGTKIGMTQIFDEAGRAIPVTVIEAGPCTVVQKKTEENDGYNAIQLGFGVAKEKDLNKPQKGHFEKAQLSLLRHLKEFRVDDVSAYEPGQEIKVDVFAAGDYVDVVGISKGKGFAGGIKRHGMHRGPMKHGSKYHRRPGSLGAKGPARVFLGRKCPVVPADSGLPCKTASGKGGSGAQLVVSERCCSRTEEKPGHHQEFGEGLNGT